MCITWEHYTLDVLHAWVFSFAIFGAFDAIVLGGWFRFISVIQNLSPFHFILHFVDNKVISIIRLSCQGETYIWQCDVDNRGCEILMENKIDRHTILQAGQRVFQVGQLCEPLPQILRFYFPDSKTHFNLSKQNMRVLFRLSWRQRWAVGG